MTVLLRLVAEYSVKLDVLSRAGNVGLISDPDWVREDMRDEFRDALRETVTREDFDIVLSEVFPGAHGHGDFDGKYDVVWYELAEELWDWALSRRTHCAQSAASLPPIDRLTRSATLWGNIP